VRGRHHEPLCVAKANTRCCWSKCTATQWLYGDPTRKKMGTGSKLTSDVEVTDVFVPATRLADRVGSSLRSRAEAPLVWPNGRPAQGCCLGQCGFAHAEATCVRECLGSSLAHFQHWQFRMARSTRYVWEAARYCYQKGLG